MDFVEYQVGKREKKKKEERREEKVYANARVGYY